MSESEVEVHDAGANEKQKDIAGQIEQILTIGKLIIGGFITGFIGAVALGSNYAQTLNRLDQSEKRILSIESDRAERIKEFDKFRLDISNQLSRIEQSLKDSSRPVSEAGSQR